MTAGEANQVRRVDDVRTMMADIVGDDAWLAVSLDRLASWLDLGPSWAPTEHTTRELCEELIEQSVAPEHCS